MYSNEDRIRAVEFYIKLGKRVRPTIREYEQRLDLPAGYAGREPKFSPAQKAAAIERAGAIMSLIQSAKLNGLDAHAYLRDVRQRLPTHRVSQIGQLLTHRWRPACT